MTESIAQSLKPRFDGTINLGHILSAVALMVTVGGIGAMSIRTDANTQLQIAAMSLEINNLKPRVATTESVVALNSERITNTGATARALRDDLTTNVAELRKADSDLATEINTAKIGIAGLEAAAKYGRASK